MLTTKDINRIYAFRAKGKSINFICKTVGCSNKTVIKFSKAEQKEPTTPYLLERIIELEATIKILKDEVKSIRTPQPAPPPSTQNKSSILVHTQEPEKADAVPKYITVKEMLMENPKLFYDKRQVQKMCKKAEYKQDLSRKGKPYMIPMGDVWKFKRTVY